jgi:hypothetical protein
MGTTGTAPRPAAISDWQQGLPADSAPTCMASGCAGDGRDEDWQFAPETFCAVQAMGRDGGPSVNFVQSTATGLYWQDASVSGVIGTTAAGNFCDPSNWQPPSTPASQVAVPTPMELVELLDFADVANANSNPSLAPAGLSQRPPDLFWARTTDNTPTWWTVDFQTGAFSQVGLVGTTARVRCVDVAPGVPAPMPGAQCGTDSCSMPSGLTFSFPDGVTRTWANALRYCNNLGPTCGEYRLPSYKELASLVNFTSGVTGLAPIDALSGTYWSSTPAPGSTTQSMSVSFVQPDGLGHLLTSSAGQPDDVGNHNQVLCVKGP